MHRCSIFTQYIILIISILQNLIFKHALTKIYSQIQDLPTIVKIKTSKTQVTKIEGIKGTIILLPHDVFGLPDSSEVTFSLREAYSLSDILAENLSTKAGDNMLATGGMVKITATFQGKEIQPTKPYTLMMPKDNTNPMRDSMQLFYGKRDANGNMNWANNSPQLFQPNRRNSLVNMSNALVKYKKVYAFMSDTCSCNKIYVWKMPKKLWKTRVKQFKEGKLSELPKRYIYSDIKPLRYDYYKVNTRSYKSLTDCGDTLSNFCKIIAVNNKSKTMTWKQKHKFIEEWVIYKNKKKDKYKTYLTGSESYRYYKVKTYDAYMKALKYQIDTIEQKIAQLEAERNENRRYIIDSVLNKNRNLKANELSEIANYYIYEASEFGWANCDYFSREDKELLTNIETNQQYDNNLSPKLIFKERNIIFPPSLYDTKITFNNVKEDEKAVFVSIKSDSSKAYLAMKEFKTEDRKVDVKYQEMTPQLLRERLKTLDKCQIKLSPNPANDIVNVAVNLNFNNIQVVNQSGQVVFQDRVNMTTSHQINVATLPTAIHFIRIFDGGILRGVEKFMVNH